MEIAHWTLDPLQVGPVVLVAALYLRRVATVRRRGQPLPDWRVAAFLGGLFLILVALVSPIDWLGENRSFAIHMAQHLLLGDLAPLLLVLGVTGPVLRPVLALPGLGWLRALTNPILAFVLWAVDLYLWHMPLLYQGALSNDAVHALEHLCFTAGGILIWAALLEPLPAPQWFGTGYKFLYVLAIRMTEAVLANIFIWSGDVFYPHYAEGERIFGVSPIRDQSLAGVVMLVEGSIVTILTLAWLFFRAMSESEAEQEMIERGLDPEAVGRAVRYGRGADYAAAHAEPGLQPGQAGVEPPASSS